MANKIKLTIGGMDLIVTTDDNEAYVQSVGNEVNNRIREITNKSPFLSTTMACVFASLEYCDESRKARMNTADMEERLKSYREEVACARLESDEARREIERLNKENQTLRGKLSRK